MPVQTWLAPQLWEKTKGAATLSTAPHWITPGKNYLQGGQTLEFAW